MRTTPSRFSTFVTPTERDFEGAPTLAPGAAAGKAVDVRSELERSVLETHYPAVVRVITHLWGQPELNQYFARIWNGQDVALTLAPDAMAEAMLLSGIHQRICPFGPARSVEDLYGERASDAWSAARPRR